MLDRTYGLELCYEAKIRDFLLTDSDKTFRAELRDLLARELLPRAPAIENDNDWTAVTRAIRALGEAGYLTLMFPICTAVPWSIRASPTRPWSRRFQPRAAASSHSTISSGLSGWCPSSVRRTMMRCIDSIMFSQEAPKGV